MGGASDPANLNLTGLARAAVAGDEKALDLFSSWRPNMVERLQASSENLNAYAGSASGVIYYLSENGSCMEVLQVGGKFTYLSSNAYGLNVIVFLGRWGCEEIADVE